MSTTDPRSYFTWLTAWPRPHASVCGFVPLRSQIALIQGVHTSLAGLLLAAGRGADAGRVKRLALAPTEQDAGTSHPSYRLRPPKLELMGSLIASMEKAVRIIARELQPSRVHMAAELVSKVAIRTVQQDMRSRLCGFLAAAMLTIGAGGSFHAQAADSLPTKKYYKEFGDVIEEVSRPEEAKGDPCKSTSMLLTELKLGRLEDQASMFPPYHKDDELRRLGQLHIDLALHWGNRGCLSHERSLYLEMFKVFYEPQFAALRQRAQIGIDDIRGANQRRSLTATAPNVIPIPAR